MHCVCFGYMLTFHDLLFASLAMTPGLSTYVVLQQDHAVLQDAVVMFIGCVMLAVATGTTSNGWVIMYAIAQLVFGFGVGGMYALACLLACILVN